MKDKQLKDLPVIGIIRKLKNKLIAPRSLSKETRQECVEVLMNEGYNVVQLAQIFGRTERTIRRDLEEIRNKNVLAPNIELIKKLIRKLDRKCS